MKKVLTLFLLTLGCVANAATLDEMIGQMVLVGFKGTEISSPAYKTLKKQIKKSQVGGVIILKHNVQNKDQITTLMNDLKSIKTTSPLFIGLDQEGGIVHILGEENGFKNHLSAYKTAQTKSTSEAYEMYYDLANMCKNMGFNLNFAPNVDLLINKNSIIAKKERGFSENPTVVTDYAREALKAHYNNRVITSLKHFPGHGSPTGDTHKGLVNASDTWSDIELIPYKELYNNNPLQMIMISHIYVDKLDNEYPASLSKTVVNDILRKQIGFNGVVITDDLQMGAIRENYSLEEIVINAINAGDDILMFSNYFYEDYKTPIKIQRIIKKAIKDKKIKKEQIKESYNRILILKQQLKTGTEIK